MLDLRPVCENCGKKLPNESIDAMICTYECTFCTECVNNILHNVCPNCGGGFEKRPHRPSKQLLKHPPNTEGYIKPVDLEAFNKLLLKYKDINPVDR